MVFFQQYHIIIIGILFLGIIGYMTFLTWQEKKWIKKHYNKKDIIALGFGITCFGLSSNQGTPEKKKGFLLIHNKGMLFKSRFSNTLFDIPSASIRKVYHADSHKKTRLYQSAVKIDFAPSGKTIDTIAFKVAYPDQWIKIIGKNFLTPS